MILLNTGQYVPGRKIVAGANSAIPTAAALAVAEAGRLLLLRAGTECENDTYNRAGAGLTILDLRDLLL
jgi:hypothetical protein